MLAHVLSRVILRQGVVCVYLALLAVSFLYTVLRWEPLLNVPFVGLEYQIMAPFQSFSTEGTALLAEGQLPSGAWRSIPLAAYFPFDAGETMDRSYLFTFAARSAQARIAAYRDLASQLLAHERQAGKPYVALQLWWARWPLCAAPLAVQPPPFFSTRTFLTRVP